MCIPVLIYIAGPSRLLNNVLVELKKTVNYGITGEPLNALFRTLYMCYLTCYQLSPEAEVDWSVYLFYACLVCVRTS